MSEVSRLTGQREMDRQAKAALQANQLKLKKDKELLAVRAQTAETDVRELEKQLHYHKTERKAKVEQRHALEMEAAVKNVSDTYLTL